MDRANTVRVFGLIPWALLLGWVACEGDSHGISGGVGVSGFAVATGPGFVTTGVGGGGVRVAGGAGGSVSLALGGAANADAGAGGAFAEGGAAGAREPLGPDGLDCLSEGRAVGEPASCEPRTGDSCCARCAKARCCAEYSQCFAEAPDNLCGSAEEAELRACILDGFSAWGFEVVDRVAECTDETVAAASQPLCGASSVAPATLELAECLEGNGSALSGCFQECYVPLFEEATCEY